MFTIFHYLARQLDNIVIGGLKMFVNIPKYGRETQRKVALATKPQGREERYQLMLAGLDHHITKKLKIHMRRS